MSDEDERATIGAQQKFTIVPEPLGLDPSVSDRALRLWIRLDRIAKGGRVAMPSRATMADAMGTTDSTIDRLLRELVKSGWLLKHDSEPGAVCDYTLVTYNLVW